MSSLLAPPRTGGGPTVSSTLQKHISERSKRAPSLKSLAVSNPRLSRRVCGTAYGEPCPSSESPCCLSRDGRATAYRSCTYALVALPVLGLLTLAVCVHRRTIGRDVVAQVLPLIVLTGLLDMFILRDPVTARVGGMAGPAAVLGAWLVGTQRPHRRVGVLTRPTRLRRVVAWTTRGVGVAALVLLIKAMSITGEWEERLSPDILAWSHVTGTFDRLSSAPADWPRFIEPRYTKIVEYVRECTRENDRILVSWFFPELYYFAQRSFAGGHVVVFGEHWSEDRFQKRSIEELAARPALVVILEGRGFAIHYAELDEYIRGRYRTDGVTNFGDSGLAPDHYTVLVLNDRAPTRIHPATALSCFT